MLVICVLIFTVFIFSFMHINSFFLLVLGVLPTSESSIAVNDNEDDDNNNNNNKVIRFTQTFRWNRPTQY